MSKRAHELAFGIAICFGGEGWSFKPEFSCSLLTVYGLSLTGRTSLKHGCSPTPRGVRGGTERRSLRVLALCGRGHSKRRPHGPSVPWESGSGGRFRDKTSVGGHGNPLAGRTSA